MFDQDRVNSRHGGGGMQSSEQAVWRTMLDDEAFEESGFSSGTAVIDLAKAYEYICLNNLVV